MDRMRAIQWIAGGLLLVGAAAGCSSHDPTAPGSGTFNVVLGASSQSVPQTLSMAGDSPEVLSLLLTFDAIRVFPAGSDTETCGWGDSAGTCPYVSVLDQPVTVDAAALGETLGALLGSTALPAGEYSQLAIRVSEAIAILPDSSSRWLEMPGQSGRLNILAPFTVTDGGTTELTLVMDVSRSIHTYQQGSFWTLQPVLHTQVREGGR